MKNIHFRKKLMIGISITAVILLTLTSFSNVVGYQTIQTSQQNLIEERINQRELLFQTIVDIANNNEIQRIILKSQISRGIFPTSDIPVITKNQLKQMFLIGIILSKFIINSKMQSIVQQNQLINSEIQKEISTVIEKDTTISNELTQLKNSECDCESDITAIWHFPIICIIGYVLFCIGINHFSPYGNLLGYFFIFIGSFIGIKFNCDWY